MVAHDGDQDFVREAQKGGIEIALDDTGIFVEIGHQHAKRGVFVDAVASPLGVGFQLRGDFLLTSGGTNDHAILLEFLFVVREVADVNGACAEEAVAARGAAGSDAGDREFQWSAVEYGDDPADGTNEPCTVQAGPGHGARPGKVVHSAGQNGDQDLFSGSAELGLFGGKVFALGRLDQIKIADVDTLLLGEALGGTCRRADSIVSNRFRRTGHFDLDIGLLGAQSLNPGDQTTRRAEGFDRYTVK